MSLSHEESVAKNIKSFNSADVYDKKESINVFTSVFAKTLLEKEIKYGGTYGDFDKPFSGISAPNKVEASNLNGKVIMDFACGTGMVSKKIIPHLSKGTRLDGVDINGVFLERFDQVTKPLAEEAGVEVSSYKVDILDSKEAELVSSFESEYDLIYCTLSYHHLHNYEAVTAKLATFLKPNGLLYIIDFYNSDVEKPAGGGTMTNHSIEHMGGLKKSALTETFRKAGLHNIKVAELYSINSWVQESFFKGHARQSVYDAFMAGQLPKRLAPEGDVYATTCDFILGIGER